MFAENLPPAFAEFDNSAELDLEKVLALQALVMGSVRTMAKAKGRLTYAHKSPWPVGTRSHGYCILQNSGIGIEAAEDIYTNELDRYVGVNVRRIGFARAWSMGISFRENLMTRMRYAEHKRTLYQLRWTDNVALGRKEMMSLLPVADNIVVVHENARVVTMETPEAAWFPEVTPLEEAELQALSSQVLDFAQTTQPRAA